MAEETSPELVHVCPYNVTSLNQKPFKTLLTFTFYIAGGEY